MADERDPIEQLLDAALFGPVGLLLELRDRFPELATKGREHVQTQVTVARMVGRFAVRMGSKKVAEYVQRQRAAAPGSDAAESGARAAADAGGFPGSVPAAGPSVGDEPGVPEGWVAADLVPTDAADLPIAGYDTLAASQVVARLDGLDAAGLEAVRAYEATHRNRKTILGKVAQLQRAA